MTDSNETTGDDRFSDVRRWAKQTVDDLEPLDLPVVHAVSAVEAAPVEEGPPPDPPDGQRLPPRPEHRNPFSRPPARYQPGQAVHDVDEERTYPSLTDWWLAHPDLDPAPGAIRRLVPCFAVQCAQPVDGEAIRVLIADAWNYDPARPLPVVDDAIRRLVGLVDMLRPTDQVPDPSSWIDPAAPEGDDQ